MAWTTIRENITVQYPRISITGDIAFDPDQCMLIHQDPYEGDEDLSIDLRSAGYVGSSTLSGQSA